MLGGGGLGVADEAVGPEVGDVDFDGVVAGVKEGVGAEGPGLLPEGLSGFAVDADGGYFVDFAEGEPELLVVGGVGRR